MFVTPSGPNTSSRFGDASQCSVSLTSWLTITVGMFAPFVVRLLRRLSHEVETRPDAGAEGKGGESQHVRRQEAPDRRDKIGHAHPAHRPRRDCACQSAGVLGLSG